MARESAKAAEAKAIPFPETRALGDFRVPQNILVIGCGGTGAYVAGHLARLVAVLNRISSWRRFRLTLADGDKVEQKNLERQHFVQRDLDANKAEILAARYAAAFGIEIAAVSSYLEDAGSLSALNPQLLIGCVDNNASRQMMHHWMRVDTYNDRFWIDSGNEEDSGQVVCGFVPTHLGCGHDSEAGDGRFSLPMVTEVYPELLAAEDKFNSQLSCAELAQSAPQNMMTNITAAAIVLNFAQKILRGKAMRSHGAVFSVDNSFRTMLNTPENLARVDSRRLRKWEKPFQSQTL